MMARFHNRAEAGRLLAEKLAAYSDRPDVIVVGLPRGGIPVAAAIAHRLRVPLDVLVVCKIGVPGNPELAMGALAAGGSQVMNDDLIKTFQIPAALIEQTVAQKQEELAQREEIYGRSHVLSVTKDETIILVDDGISTGATARAAINALRAHAAAKIILATPVIADSLYHDLRGAADKIVFLRKPEPMYGVSAFYENFPPVTDQEALHLLAEARAAYSVL
jgi:putative phosphoribosyl transferase